MVSTIVKKRDGVARRVIGVDCGLALVGWEVLEMRGNKYVHIDGGVIETKKDQDTQMRLKKIFDDLTLIVEKLHPSEMAVEELFYFKNNTTVIGVSEARGVIRLVAALKQISLTGYTPLEVKVAVTGYGRSEKKQVQLMVKRLLNLSYLPKPDDWADAIAVAICHFNTKKQ